MFELQFIACIGYEINAWRNRGYRRNNKESVHWLLDYRLKKGKYAAEILWETERVGKNINTVCYWTYDNEKTNIFWESWVQKQRTLTWSHYSTKQYWTLSPPWYSFLELNASIFVKIPYFLCRRTRFFLQDKKQQTTWALKMFESSHYTSWTHLSSKSEVMGDIFYVVTFIQTRSGNYMPYTNRVMSFLQNEASLRCMLTTAICSPRCAVSVIVAVICHCYTMWPLKRTVQHAMPWSPQKYRMPWLYFTLSALRPLMNTCLQPGNITI